MGLSVKERRALGEIKKLIDKKNQRPKMIKEGYAHNEKQGDYFN